MSATEEAEVIGPNHAVVLQGRRHFREVLSSGSRMAARSGDKSEAGAAAAALQIAISTFVADEFQPVPVLNAFAQTFATLICTYAPVHQQRLGVLSELVKMIVERIDTIGQDEILAQIAASRDAAAQPQPPLVS